MRRLELLPILLAFASAAKADEHRPILDCTGPKGADAKTVAVAQKAWAKRLGETSHEKTLPLDKAGKVTVEMVLIPPGKYYRGEGKSATLITLTQPLWVGKYEVTQRQYEAVMGSNPSHFAREGKDAALYPVECVSHIDALKFCQAASEAGGEFRLPTEAEWEYACRAGTRTRHSNGDSDDRLGEVAQFGGNNRKATEKIGSKSPNAFGLFDMAGNVWEWCQDPWTDSYDMRTTTDPAGPETGQGCVTRGGSWASSADNCRSAHRSRDAETYGGSHLGFRIAWTPTRTPRKPPAPLDCTGPKGADAREVVAAQRAWARHLGEYSHEKAFPLDKAGKVTVEMVLLPPGKYCRGDEKKPVAVTLTRPLWVGKYEVTQRQYQQVTGKNPAHFRKEGADAALYPVEKVSHQDAVRFCKSASENTGSGFRLLWEAEWEYAYRAGTRTRYYNGDSHDAVVEIAQCTENNFVSTAKVGSKLPNAFGLYDMGGNVAEWCADVYQRDFVETRTADPRGPATGTIHVNRGNAWDSYARTCNATARSASTKTYGGSQLGFRLARAAAPLDAKKPTIEIIDTHTHFYDPTRKEGVPWPGKDDKLLYRRVLPDEFEKLSKPHGVVGTVVVEASPRVEDNQWLLDLAAKQKVIVGVVGRLDPVSDDFEKNLRRFAANPLYRGIRINHNELKAGLKGNLVERCKLLADLGLVLDVNGGPDMPADVALLAAKLPKLRIVINHAANLRIDGKEPPKAWRDGMAAAAKHPNVYCKVSALVEQAGSRPAPRDPKHYRPVLDALWNIFGEDRLVFASNWPVSVGGAPYEHLLGIVQEYLAAKGEKASAKFFHGNSRAVYGWRKR